MTPLAPLRSAAEAVHAVRTWPVSAQQRARRNAMVALTECTQRRAEREDVERFLATHRSRHDEVAVPLHA